VPTVDVQEIISQARDVLTVRRVFGEPYEKNGVTVIPAAVVRGGAGGGSGEGQAPEGGGQGSGSGFGVAAKPSGAYVIRGDRVQWQPALDINRVILGGQIVAIFALLTVRAIAQIRAERRNSTRPQAALLRMVTNRQGRA
jgi:uncharacterized spore protein YtfJ